MKSNHLQNNSRIAVIGGGPAGCFFALLLKHRAREMGYDPGISIFNSKKFIQGGPPGCNMCAGVIGNNLNVFLGKLGIDIVPVTRNVIEGYELHMRNGTVYIKKDEGSRIYTVFRGGGPDIQRDRADISFDQLVLEEALALGCELHPFKVKQMRRSPDGKKIILSWDDSEDVFDFVAGAFGVNSRPMDFFLNPPEKYHPPPAWHTCQAEVRYQNGTPPQETIHVFNLGLENIKFVTFTPKKRYLTISAVGEHVRLDDLREAMSHPKIMALLPADAEICCHCHPKLPVADARLPFGRRYIIIGDAGYSRFLKNGIESAYWTAKFAVEGLCRYGLTGEALNRYYYRKCRGFFSRDNTYGRLLFKMNDTCCRKPFISRKMLSAAAAEKSGGRFFSYMLWNMFTGDRAYRDIIRKLLSPAQITRRFILKG